MKTSSFFTALRSNSTLPLVFRSGADVVAPGYHLTEVKRVGYETMDCGATTHRWAENQFEVWVPARAADDVSKKQYSQYIQLMSFAGMLVARSVLTDILQMLWFDNNVKTGALIY